MTLQIHTTGPGNADWQSQKFTVAVNGTDAYVYGYARDCYSTSLAWQRNDIVEQSWLNYGSDEVTTLSVSLVSGDPITEAIVYPKNLGITSDISAGVLTLSGVPTNVRFRVEVNGDRAEALHVFSSPLKSEIPASRVDWTTRVYPAAVNPALNVVVATGLGTLAVGETRRVLLHSTGDLPTTTAGTLAPYEIVQAVGIGLADTVVLVDQEGFTVEMSDAGTGTVTLAEVDWTDTSTALYFPAGEHHIGRLFDLVTGVELYIDEGAVVTGSFDCRGTNGVTIRGPGLISGLYANRDNLEPPQGDPEANQPWALFYQGIEAPFATGVTLSEFTVAATPFYFGVCGSARNVKIISPWTWNTDGFRGHNMGPNDPRSEVVDCFVFATDDCVFINQGTTTRTITGNFIINAGNSAIHGAYFPQNMLAGRPCVMEDNDVITLSIADSGSVTGSPQLGGASVIHGYTDGYYDQQHMGHHNVTIRDLRVWGPVACRPVTAGNKAYPFSGQEFLIREQYGSMKDWLLEDIWFEERPGQLGIFWAKDQYNRPSNWRFTGIEFGGVEIHQNNLDDFFDVDPLIDDFVWDPFIYIPPQATEEAGMLSELEAVNTMLATIGAAPVNTLAGTVSADVATAKHILSEVKANILLKGWAFNSDYGVPMAPQNDGKIRAPQNTLRIDTDPAVGFQGGVDPVQRGDYLYDRKKRSYTFSGPLTCSLVVDLDWNYLPEVARRFIEARAAVLFANRMDADERRMRTAEQNLYDAQATMQQHETDTADHSFLGGASQRITMGSLRR